MMSLYPTLEDLKVDGLLKAQGQVLSEAQRDNPESYSAIANFMGLDLNSFHYNDHGELVPGPVTPGGQPPAPVSPGQLVMRTEGAGTIVAATSAPGEIRHGVRRVVLCKGNNGKVGVQLTSVDTGIFVSFVANGSPAALGGLRFGDQLLSICGTLVSGKTGSQAMDILRKGPTNNIEVLVRDRPFERTIVVNKSSSGDIGLSIECGEIKQIVKDSSAARNGILTRHQIVEIDGQNVLGLKDRQLKELLHKNRNSVRLTILPVDIYKHMIKSLWKNQIRHEMDRSLPDA